MPDIPADWGAPPPDDIEVALRDVYKAFGPNIRILRGLSLEVERGTSAVVMGGSGTGKSMLIKHVVKLLEPDDGEVWVQGKRMDLLEGDALDKQRLQIGYLFQSGALFDSMTVAENMDFFLTRNTDLDAGEREERITETLEWVSLAEKAPAYPAELSGGQKKRIGLARSLVLQPAIMLYDEPTTGLDPISVRAVSDLIVRLREERGITSITITHDLTCAEIITDRAHFLHEGHFAASGTLDELRQADHPMIREFFDSAIV
jgi:phospholipid/cholesterol/gamma-HCH transport system ATP-binding protein